MAVAIGHSALEEAQIEAAAGRVEARARERTERVDQLKKAGGIGKADDQARVAARLDRLSRHWARAPRPTAGAEVPAGRSDEVLAAALERGRAWGAPVGEVSMKEAGKILERVIGTADFVGINYLETGVVASHAVGRVNIRDASGRVVGYGTGSMVSPRVLLTNHHVLPDADTARSSVIEFDFEDGPDGQPRQAKRFPFSPDALFVADAGLDFALVAVGGDRGELASYGHNPLIEAQGKAIVGEFVTIVQHPRGERKQIALRENRIVDVIEDFLHYEADTEPGSSGSLVFNDQWETVALHHASVPAPDRADQGGYINEGIRISRVIGKLREMRFEGEALALSEEVVAPASDRPVGPTPIPSGDGGGGANGGGAEKVTIDTDYSNREGYDPDFLGKGRRSVALPELSDEQLADAATNGAATNGGSPSHLIPYHHFSLAMNAARRLAFFTAVNIDGALSRRLKREADRWSLDPRIPEEAQAGEFLYSDNPLDRGHLVRRLDPAWGESEEAVKEANDDTFHFTNCAPQHEGFNRNARTWAGLEDYILEHADNEDFKVNVFSGPVFAEDDPVHRGVGVPQQFWKVVAMTKKPGVLSATGYLLSQADLVADLDGFEGFAFGEFKTFQVRVTDIEKLTGLSFGSLSDHDPLATHEAARVEPVELKQEADARL